MNNKDSLLRPIRPETNSPKISRHSRSWKRGAIKRRINFAHFSFRRSVSAAGNFQFVEATIPELQAAMASGQLTSARLVRGYLDRIYSLNPLLHSVIQTNPARRMHRPAAR